MIDDSINQTLIRSIKTNVTVFLVCLALFVLNFGQRNVLEGFSFCLLVGTVIGSYSTIAIASPLLLFLPWFWEKVKSFAPNGKLVSACVSNVALILLTPFAALLYAAWWVAFAAVTFAIGLVLFPIWASASRHGGRHRVGRLSESWPLRGHAPSMLLGPGGTGAYAYPVDRGTPAGQPPALAAFRSSGLLRPLILSLKGRGPRFGLGALATGLLRQAGSGSSVSPAAVRMVRFMWPAFESEVGRLQSGRWAGCGGPMMRPFVATARPCGRARSAELAQARRGNAYPAYVRPKKRAERPRPARRTSDCCRSSGTPHKGPLAATPTGGCPPLRGFGRGTLQDAGPAAAELLQVPGGRRSLMTAFPPS